MVQYALPLQYSVYYARLDKVTLQAFINKLNAVIHHQRDDIRIYPVASNTLAKWPKIGCEGDDKFLLIT